MRLGLIARADDSGLGIQTQRLGRFLNPTKVLAIDYSDYKGDHMKPHWERFSGNVRQHKGLLDYEAMEWITDDVDAVLTCEIDYAHGQIYRMARRKGVRSLIQFNYEFLENLRDENFPMPDVFIAPSPWNTERLPQHIRDRMVQLDLPLENNWQEDKDPKVFLHVVGKNTAEDRNGTQLVWDALQCTNNEFMLLVTHQDELKVPDDKRIKDLGYVDDMKEVYQQAAHLVLPRRFGGQSLVIQEAYASNCAPILLENDPYTIGRKIPSMLKKRIHVYTMIQVFECNPWHIAKEMSNAMLEPNQYKEQMKEYTRDHSFENMLPLWLKVLKKPV